jgi:hypothetical protein
MKMEYVPAPELQIWASVMPMKYVPRAQPELTPEQLAESAEYVAAAEENKARGWSND